MRHYVFTKTDTTINPALPKSSSSGLKAYDTSGKVPIPFLAICNWQDFDHARSVRDRACGLFLTRGFRRTIRNVLGRSDSHGKNGYGLNQGAFSPLIFVGTNCHGQDSRDEIHEFFGCFSFFDIQSNKVFFDLREERRKTTFRILYILGVYWCLFRFATNGMRHCISVSKKHLLCAGKGILFRSVYKAGYAYTDTHLLGLG